MFEFEDNDFTLLENFSLSIDEDGHADFGEMGQLKGTYLGDGVWAVDVLENSEEAEQVPLPVSES